MNTEEIMKRNENILAFIEEFARKLAVQPDVLEAVHEKPAFLGLAIGKMALCFEEALRAEIPVTVIEGKAV